MKETKKWDKCQKLIGKYWPPNRKKMAKLQWMLDNRKDVALNICNRNIGIISSGKGDGFVWMENTTVVTYGCYISPNIDRAQLILILFTLRKDMRKQINEILVGGYFNAK